MCLLSSHRPALSDLGRGILLYVTPQWSAPFISIPQGVSVMRAGLYLCVYCCLSGSRHRAWHRVTLKEYLLMTAMSKAWKVATPKGSLICTELFSLLLPPSDQLVISSLSLTVSWALFSVFLAVQFSGFCPDPSLCPALGTPATPVTASTTFVLMAMKCVSSALNFARIDFLHLPLTVGQLTEAQNISVGKQIRIYVVRSLT